MSKEQIEKDLRKWFCDSLKQLAQGLEMRCSVVDLDAAAAPAMFGSVLMRVLGGFFAHTTSASPEEAGAWLAAFVIEARKNKAKKEARPRERH